MSQIETFGHFIVLRVFMSPNMLFICITTTKLSITSKINYTQGSQKKGYYTENVVIVMFEDVQLKMRAGLCLTCLPMLQSLYFQM